MSASSNFQQALVAIEGKLDTLLHEREQLVAENQALRLAASKWQHERAQLVEKNELARTRVEAMITRLKSLESDV